MINIRNEGNHYFAAANTSSGFKSYFSDIFSIQNCHKLYILKGGPGVGKSTFMKTAAKCCEELGMTVEYYRCSSDPDSLDGIVIKDIKTAIADGTSPHAMEAGLAGAYEEIIDLGKAWDTKKLFENRDELLKLTNQKKQCYKNAYNILSVCKEIKNILRETIKSYIDFEKAQNSVVRLTKGILCKSNGLVTNEEKIRLVNAISCKGRVHLCTFEDNAKMCVFIKEDKHVYGISHMYITMLYEVAKKKGAEMLVSFSPFDTSVIDGLFFVKEKISVTLYDDELVKMCDRVGKKCRIINASRFVDFKSMHSSKEKRKFYEKLCHTLETKADLFLEEAGKSHALLEKIYSSCTDYKIVEKLRKDFLKTLTNTKKPRQ